MTRYAICLGLLATAILLPAPVLAQGRGHAGSNGHRAGGHQAQNGMGMMPYGGMGTMPYSSTGMMP